MIVKAAWVLSSDDLVLQVDSERTRQNLHKQSEWIKILKAGIWLNKLWFTVLIKSVYLNTLDFSNQIQKMVWETLIQQESYLKKIELPCWLRAGLLSRLLRQSLHSLSECEFFSINQSSHTELVLHYVHYAVELFRQDCHITHCYQCQSLGHMIWICYH